MVEGLYAVVDVGCLVELGEIADCLLSEADGLLCEVHVLDDAAGAV